jgi:Ca2+/Na+ antiporter
MDIKKIGRLILAALLIIGGIILAVKLISGAFALLSGALDTILGIVLILALAAIVIWMFRYAAKNKK